MLNKILNQIFLKYFLENEFKFVYLHNELFISLFKSGEFVIYGLKLKADKLLVNSYSGLDSKLLKVFEIIVSKYSDVFINFLKLKKKKISFVGEEAEFINIFDKEELSYDEVKSKLSFTFLDDYSFRRRKEMNFELEKSYIEIYHSDFECSICDGPKESFTNFPDYTDKVDYNYFPEYKDVKSIHLNTYITDYESISIGGNPKVSEILSNKNLINNHEMVTLNKTCISVIMGDDIESIFKYNNIPAEKTIYTDQNIDSGYKAVINFLKNINIENSLEKYDNSKIIFFGLAKTRGTYELIKFLDDNFGIKVEKVLIPNINKEDLEEILKYKLGVFFNGLEIKTQSVFKMYPLDNIESSIPYGLTKTKDLITNILLKIGKDNLGLEDLFNSILEKNISLIKEADNYTFGFIIHPFHLRYFIEDNFRGVPIISLLNDMGFNFKFFVYDNNISMYENDLELFKSKKFNFEVGSDNIALENFIKNEDINLIYSEISNDQRLLKFNKNQFSVGDFDYGIDGFFRTLNRLLMKCRKQLYFNSLIKK